MMAISIEKLPASIRNSEVLSRDELAKLTQETVPSDRDVDDFAQEPEVSAILESFPDNPDERLAELHKLAQEYLEQDKIEEAWKTLLQA